MPRQPIHRRGNAIRGSGRLNEKAIKVLAAIKFASVSSTKDDIMDATSLPGEDVQRQVTLLKRLQLLHVNSRFPDLSHDGWRVNTKFADHHKITDLLKQHGVEDPKVAHAREILGEYYDVCAQRDYYTGKGQQQNLRQGYINSTPPYVPEINFRPEVSAKIHEFKAKKPWQPKEFSEDAVAHKKELWQWIIKELADLYEIRQPIVKFGEFTQETWTSPGSSGGSYWAPYDNVLMFDGKFSVTTLFHEFAHARGYDERDAIIWSFNLGIRHWPKIFDNLWNASRGANSSSHLLIVPEDRTFMG
jgi:hypothetical protein